VNRWLQFVRWFLIALTLVIVMVPQLDLPATIMRAIGGAHKIPCAAFTAIVYSSIALSPRNSHGLQTRIAFPHPGTLLASLIDFNHANLLGNLSPNVTQSFQLDN